MDEAASGASSPEFKDRSGRLLLFGLVAVGVGCVCFALGALQLVLLRLGELLPGAPTYSGGEPTVAMGAALYGLIGCAFLWVGVGSMRRRRWVRPLMLTLAWTWLVGGLVAALMTPMAMDLLARSSPDLGQAVGLLVTIQIFVLALVAGFGILLPAAFVWAYRDPDLQRTCEAHDPGPCWTDRCPPPVLGLSVSLAACALLALPMLARPVIPVFDILLTGWPAVALLLVGASVCGGLARSTFLLRISGWWGAVALLSLLGVSSAVSVALLDPAELQQAIGYDGVVQGAAPVAGMWNGWLALGIPIVFTAAGLVYMAGIRKHFKRPASGETAVGR